MTLSALAPEIVEPAGLANRRAAAAHGIARVKVCTRPDDIADEWTVLERQAPASPYQTRAFLLPWLDTIGRARGMRPLYSVAYSATGQAIGMLPLAVMNRGPFRLAEFAGGKDANFTFALVRPELRPDSAGLRHWLAETARQSPERIDLFALVNQPESWNGAVNPLRALGGQSSPAHGHRTSLLQDPDAFMKARLSADGRKKLRAKERNLSKLGAIAHVKARDATAAGAILDAFARQKAMRMHGMGINNIFADPAVEDFLARCGKDFGSVGAGGLELHALSLDGRIIAVYGGATHQGRFCGMFNSIELAPEIARHSPGDQLLSRLIAEKCREGVSCFDLGVGEARYKNMWCDAEEPLFDLYVAANPLGWAMGLVKSAKRRLKRRIKQSPDAWRLVERARKALR